MAGDLVIFEDEGLLRELALLVYKQEELAINNIQFKSEAELVKYLQVCRSNYESTLSLLQAASDTKAKLKDDNTKDSIADDIYYYLVKCLNASLQAIRNYSLRKDYLEKIKSHADDLLKTVEELDPTDVAKVRSLAETATKYRDYMDKFLDKYQSGLSKQFSKLLKASGIKFDELVTKYQAELNLAGRFEDLEDVDKLRVYNKIIEASGRGEIVTDVVDTAFGVTGVAALIFLTGTMVWDIFSSERPVKTATEDAVMAVANVGGAAIGEVVEAAVATYSDVIEGSAIFMTATGLLSGFVASFIITTVAGLLIDLIFGSGGTAPLSNEGYHCYVAPLPDGAALARQIAHEHGLKNETKT